MKERILTGDRPTGPLHLGHFFGSLQKRIQLQDDYETFIIIADWQVLYDHLEDEKGKSIENNIREVLLDNLAVGLDPDKVNFFIQSEIPELAELTMVFQFLVTVARAKRNPTIKSEMISANILQEAKNLTNEDFYKAADKINVGFLSFPISQAADILLPRAHLVPVGEDQLAHIEQTREIARKFNSLFGDTFPEPEGLVSETSRLRGIDGDAKMSKSLGNVIELRSTPEEIEVIIKKAYTGPKCPLFDYEKLVDPDVNIENLKKKHEQGEIKFSEYKPKLTKKINAFLEPIRQRREQLAQDTSFLREILNKGRDRMREIGQETMKEVREKMKMVYRI